MQSINLWEIITAVECLHRRDVIYPTITREDITALARSTRFYSQELSLQATEEGWLLNIFACDSESHSSKVSILIPKDGTKPIKILKDRIGRVEYHHD